MQILKRVQCPQCGSARVWKDGFRVLADGRSVQRFLCRNCGFRFSFSQDKNRRLRSDRNMLKTERVQSFAGISPKIREKLVEFLWWMQREGYKESTIISRGSRLKRLVKLGANLFDPESVKAVIARQDQWSESMKEAMVYAYDLFVRWLGISWERPRYKRIQRLPFIPLEREIDDLIAGCGKYVAAFLQIGKETAARAGEIFALRWIDVDFENKTIRITPEKGSNPRVFKISSKLIKMLNQLPREGERIFSRYKTVANLRRTFERQRKRIAHKLANPRLLQISFHTLRHWRATMEYYKTKDILHVMNLLGHKNIKNTLVYTQLVKFEKDDEYICKVAKTEKEIKKLIEAGYEYLFQRDGLVYFRKRK